MSFTTVDLVADFHATGVDTDDASPMLVAFNTWARGQSNATKAAGIELTIPGDGKIYSPMSTSANDFHWMRFIPLLKVRGTGATQPLLRGTLFNTFAFPTSDQCSVRVASANAGDTTLRVLDPASDNAKLVPGRTLTQSDGLVYTAGLTLHMTGLDTIGFGDPGQQYQEYVKMVSYNSGTGIITLDSTTPLRFSYSSLWPLYNAGGPPGPDQATDCGGPATIYIMDASWDAELIWDNILFDSPNTLLYSVARKVTFQNCKCRGTGGGYGFLPSINETMIWDNFDQADRFCEADKSVTNFIIRNGSTVNQLWLQGSSIETLTVQAATINFLNGTAQNTNISGSAIGSCLIGPRANGVGGTFTADSSTFTSFSPFGVLDTDILVAGWTCSNGIIKVPNHPVVRWAVPGAICTFQGTLDSETVFKVYAVWRDTSFTYVLTSLSGGFPDVPKSSAGTRLDIAVLGATAMYVTNCSGCADAINLSQAGAYGKRFGEYTKKQYTAADTANGFAGLFAAGRLRQVNINVTTPYTGAGALSMNVFGQFNNGLLAADNSLISDLGSVINCKVGGVRSIRVTPTLVTGLGSSDMFPVPGAIWFTGGGGMKPFFSADVSANAAGPVIEIETITDLGVTPVKSFTCNFQ